MSKKTSQKKSPAPAAEDPHLKALAQECAKGSIAVLGEETMTRLQGSATNRLLVAKGLVTVDELRQAFVDEIMLQRPEIVHIAKIFGGANTSNRKPQK